ncbi:MAG: PLP-dependent aminotransferase family protein [Ruminococcus sp.]|nr:PLP-dependent aminotransferase family protein [Ruminococcus sp.]
MKSSCKALTAEVRLSCERLLRNIFTAFAASAFHPKILLSANIIIGAGTEYLTSLIMLLLGHDKCYAVENPGYKRTYRLFKRSAGRTAAIPQDLSGISVKQLRQTDADVVHTTPSHNFPLGSVMPISRRKELLDWTYEKNDRYIIEDEYDSEFRFTGSPIPSLFSLDSHGRVIYINTFTKTLAPSMRISYIILPDRLMDKFRRELDFCLNTVPLFEQLTLARFISEGFFERHINRIKKIYKSRRDLLISSLKQYMPDGSFEIKGENSGLHFLMKMNNSASEEQFIDAAAKKRHTCTRSERVLSESLRLFWKCLYRHRIYPASLRGYC